MKTQILVIDDHSIVKVGIDYITAKILNAETWGVEDLKQARKILQKRSMDLIILDIGVPDWEGMIVFNNLKKLAPRARILVCSAHNETIYALRCIDAGADGYLQKTVDQAEISNAIVTVLDGGQYLSEKMKDYIMESRLNKQSTHIGKNPLTLLTEREMEICEFLRQGLRNSEIANKLNLHVSTVSTHKVRIFQKLNVKNVNMLINKMRLYDDFIV